MLLVVITSNIKVKDKDKSSLPKKYLNEIKPYLGNMINKYNIPGAWKI